MDAGKGTLIGRHQRLSLFYELLTPTNWVKHCQHIFKSKMLIFVAAAAAAVAGSSKCRCCCRFQDLCLAINAPTRAFLICKTTSNVGR